MSVEQPYDRNLLAEACAHLGVEDLRPVLKNPFCTGEAEKIVVDQLTAKLRREFDGTICGYSKEAKTLDIEDVDRPAERPSVQDALYELTR
jgi:hypothetical protein